MTVERRALPKKVHAGVFWVHRSKIKISVGNGTILKNSLAHKILDEFLMQQRVAFTFTIQDIVDILNTNGVNRRINYICVYRWIKTFEEFLEGKIESKVIRLHGRGKIREYWLTAPLMFFIANYEEGN